MTPSPNAVLAAEIANEQAHVDRVYAELAKAAARVALLHTEGMARGQTERRGTGDPRDEELAGLFERDALVYRAAQRRASLEHQHEGLVFGRLDLDHGAEPGDSSADEREVRYVGRLGVRDDEYEPLVVDWRAPAASPFYRATPVQPHGVVRRRVLRCEGEEVVGVEDDLMVSQPPDDVVVIGDGALIAALTRSRGQRMRDIVATIQQHQDEAIRAPARGVTEITGGPGTGKTVVALHRAAYLLYADRRRYEAGGVLVVGPSAAYTAYIERVLPSLGEDSVVLRSIGDVMDGVTAARHDRPDTAAAKGAVAMRSVLARLAREPAPDAPERLRVFAAGQPVRLEADVLQRVRLRVLRHHRRNSPSARQAALQALGETAWSSVRVGDRAEFLDRFADSRDVEAFLHQWWRPVDPREMLLWLADARLARRLAGAELGEEGAMLLSASMQEALRVGSWSVGDAALLDELSAGIGPVTDEPAEERGFSDLGELDDGLGPEASRPASQRRSLDPRERLLAGWLQPAADYAHVLVDEAQDLSPMQWRMVGRRGRRASWTVVGDAAQSAWPDLAESTLAREEAFGAAHRRSFHMDTNYRNAREIFELAARLIREHVPDADIPSAVRETGVDPTELTVPVAGVSEAARSALDRLLDQVDGAVAIITPQRWQAELAGLVDGRAVLVDPLSSKGLEYDATLVVDPDEIVRESPGGPRVLYVALTRAAHRMTVLRVGAAG